MSPLVSIVMPTFDRLEYLPDTISSVFAQTFTEWELIIADDGSSAPTGAYLRALHDPPRVKVICLTHSGKPSVVRNAAMRAAQGEYVAFLDSDDLWLPTKLEVQLESLRRHPGREWSYTRFVTVDATGSPTGPASRSDWPALSGWILEPLLEEQTVIALPSVMVSRQLLQQVGPFDEELFMCEDDELWFRLAEHSEVDGVDAALTLVRRHGQHSGSDILAWRDRRRVFEKALRARRGNHLESTLCRLRAEMSAGLANSQAASGKRIAAIGTVLASAHYSWRFPQWWRGALRALAPAMVRRVIRRYRGRRLTATPTGLIS
jgi:glycosyltransferase involved in cell wall biosynthesis